MTETNVFFLFYLLVNMFSQFGSVYCRINMDSSVSAQEKGAYDHVVVNDNLEVAYEKLKGILIKVSTMVIVIDRSQP